MREPRAYRGPPHDWGQDSPVGKKLGSMKCRFEPNHGHLASLPFKIASVASERRGKNERGPNQWIKAMITPRLLTVRLPFPGCVN